MHNAPSSLGRLRVLALGMWAIAAVLAAPPAVHARDITVLDLDLRSDSLVSVFRNGEQKSFDADTSDTLASTSLRMLRNDGSGDPLVAAASFQDRSRFSALEVFADDEPGTMTEVAFSSVEYVLEFRNTSGHPIPLHLDFLLSPTLLHLEDFTTRGLGVPPGFSGFEQQGVVGFRIWGGRSTNDFPQWAWAARLSGGARDASLLEVVRDEQHIGSPTLVSGAVTAGTTVDAEYDEFSGSLNFGDLAPGEAFTLTYFIVAEVKLRGGDDTGASGGSVIAGDPFHFGTGPANSFVFTAGDFSTADFTAAVPAPSTLALVIASVTILVAKARRATRRIPTVRDREGASSS